MAMFIKAKRVSDPLDERVKARLLLSTGYGSSGSEHDADSSCFSALVHSFLEMDDPDSSQNNIAAEPINCSDEEGHDYDDAAEMVSDLLNPSAINPDLHSDVVAAAEALAGLRSGGSGGYRRAVMARLREVGYDAGICKVKWESSGGLTAGSYEYIDIVVDDKVRYIVDLDFAAQFVVARATAEYEKLVASLPRVMAGRAEEVKQVVRIVAEAARRSLKSREMSVPPWRKRRYMLAKWLGPYRRTVNPLPSYAAGDGAAARVVEVKCREVGFGPATWRVVVAPETRT